jgi:hypothetical protein
VIDPRATAEEARHGAGRLDDQMREAAHSLLHEKKERIARAVGGFAEAFRHAAGALDRNKQSGAARYAEQAATRIEHLSADVRTCDFSDIGARAGGFGSRRLSPPQSPLASSLVAY